MKKKTYNWIEKVINSCKTQTHCINANKLIARFSMMYDDEHLTNNLYTSMNYQMCVVYSNS